MAIVEGELISRQIVDHRSILRRETEGLVPRSDTPFLQPYEVYDQELFDLEMVRVFGRSWVWLGDTEDLREVGDYITGSIGYQSVVVIRQRDGGLRGFLNNCRHRASGLVFDPAGHCKKALVCPYHNWSYDIDGRLRSIPDMERMYGPDFPVERYGLIPIRVAVAWDKLVFGCLSRKVPSFWEWIDPIHKRYESYKIGTYHRYHRDLDVTYPINWKAFIENSNDDYHVRFVHRRLRKDRRLMDTEVSFAGRTCSGFKPHRHDTSGGRTDLDEHDRRGNYADFIYPNLTPLPHPTMLQMVRADPIAPDRTRLFSRIYGLAQSREEEEEALRQLEQTNKEDTDMVTVLMRNLRSPFYRVGPPTRWEARAAHVMSLIRQDTARPLAEDEFMSTDPTGGNLT